MTHTNAHINTQTYIALGRRLVRSLMHTQKRTDRNVGAVSVAAIRGNLIDIGATVSYVRSGRRERSRSRDFESCDRDIYDTKGVKYRINTLTHTHGHTERDDNDHSCA